MSITSTFKKVKPQTLKYIGLVIYILSFILFICCSVYDYPYFPITIPFLIATFCCLVAENNTNHIIDAIMTTSFAVSFTLFTYLDFKNDTDSLLSNYAQTRGKVHNIKTHTATKNWHSTVYCNILLPDNSKCIVQKDYSLIPPFHFNDSVFVIYSKENIKSSQFFKNKEDIDHWIKKTSILKFWDEAYWLRKIVIAFLLFGVIPYVLMRRKQNRYQFKRFTQ